MWRKDVAGQERYLKGKGEVWLEWSNTIYRPPPKISKNISLLMVSLYIVPQSSVLCTRNSSMKGWCGKSLFRVLPTNRVIWGMQRLIWTSSVDRWNWDRAVWSQPEELCMEEKEHSVPGEELAPYCKMWWWVLHAMGQAQVLETLSKLRVKWIPSSISRFLRTVFKNQSRGWSYARVGCFSRIMIQSIAPNLPRNSWSDTDTMF